MIETNEIKIKDFYHQHQQYISNTLGTEYLFDDYIVINDKIIELTDEVTSSLMYDISHINKAEMYDKGHMIAIQTILEEEQDQSASDVINKQMYQISYMLTNRAKLHKFSSNILQDADYLPTYYKIIESTNSLLDIKVQFNPLSIQATILCSFLNGLKQAFNHHLNLHMLLIPNDYEIEEPIAQFYRYAFNPSLMFNANDQLIDFNGIHYNHLKTSQVLTMQIDTPESWLISSTYALLDLDNIVLSNLKQQEVMNVQYILEHLLIFGQAWDETENIQVTGLKLYANDIIKSIKTDTKVVKNLGYFQLQANAGIWRITLDKKAAKMYQIQQATKKITLDEMYMKQYQIDNQAININHIQLKDYLDISVIRFNDEFNNLLVHRNQDYLDIDIASYLSSNIENDNDDYLSKKDDDETIHVFSIASGHLYERMMKIMMLSVTKHTSSPIKFWLISNFFTTI